MNVFKLKKSRNILMKVMIFLLVAVTTISFIKVNAETVTYPFRTGDDAFKNAPTWYGDTAQASDFIKTEDDLNKPITQGGLNVSGGQKQRLSIARALLRAPEILIFDDTFSALDYKTDKKLRKAISQKLKDSTCLIVAQRIGTIKNADKIIVLEDGEIEGMGKHDELLKTCKVYQEIALSQLSKEEL